MEEDPIFEVRQKKLVNAKRFNLHLSKYNPFERDISDDERMRRHLLAWREYSEETINICDYQAGRLKEIAKKLDPDLLTLSELTPEELRYYKEKMPELAREAIRHITVMVSEGCVERPVGRTIHSKPRIIPEPLIEVADGNIREASIAASMIRKIVNEWYKDKKKLWEKVLADVKRRLGESLV